MTEKLFSYGTLQMEKVQLETFGRKLVAQPDILVGYRLEDCPITDPKVLNISVKAVHPIACFTGNASDSVAGTIFDITTEELHKADDYEVDSYKRIRCTLKSGAQAWAYVQNK